MQEQKYYIAVDEYERKIIINNLNNLRNKLIIEGRWQSVTLSESCSIVTLDPSGTKGSRVSGFLTKTMEGTEILETVPKNPSV